MKKSGEPGRSNPTVPATVLAARITRAALSQLNVQRASSAVPLSDFWCTLAHAAHDSEKLDELLRALPGAEGSLIMLEEESDETMQTVEEIQRLTKQS